MWGATPCAFQKTFLAASTERTKLFWGGFDSLVREFLLVTRLVCHSCFFHIHFEQPSALYPAFPRIISTRYLRIHQEMPPQRTPDRQIDWPSFSISFRLFKLK